VGEEIKRYLDTKLAELEARLLEKVRATRNELMEGLAATSTSQALRLGQVEGDQSALEVAFRGRMDHADARLLRIEFRVARTTLFPRDPQSEPFYSVR
jgi:hypothetical protein